MSGKMSDKMSKHGRLYPSEDEIQIAIIEWLILHKLDRFVIHIPNEGKRSLSYGSKLKKMGMRKGVSDLFIAISCRDYHGAWIELKSKNGRPTPSQSQFLSDMGSQGYYTNVCYGLDDAINSIKWYLKIKS